MEKFWPTCLSRFEQELSAQQFNTWIKPLQAELTDNALRILAPNKFVLQWVKERFLSKIETIAAELLPQNTLIELAICEKISAKKTVNGNSNKNSSFAENNNNPITRLITTKTASSHNTNEHNAR